MIESVEKCQYSCLFLERCQYFLYDIDLMDCELFDSEERDCDHLRGPPTPDYDQCKVYITHLLLLIQSQLLIS